MMLLKRLRDVEMRLEQADRGKKERVTTYEFSDYLTCKQSGKQYT